MNTQRTSIVLTVVWFLGSGLLAAQNPERNLIAVDKAFNRMAREIGVKTAFLHYADDQCIKMNNKAMPLMGKEALEQWLNTLDPRLALEWKPIRAEIGISEDLGYTFGWWRLTEKDTTYYGNYVTIWKKQPDGQWKFVLDAGNTSPKPEGTAWE